MLSRSALVKAIAIPLGVCLFLLLVGLAIALFQIHRERATINWVTAQYDYDQKTLATYPKKWREFGPLVGFGLEEVGDSYMGFSTLLTAYLLNWVSKDVVLESESRIKELLFATTPSVEMIYMTASRDLRFFNNPHQYLPIEIAAHLNNAPSPRQRLAMLEHIFASILLTCVSLNGNLTKSLLPFSANDIADLGIFKTLTEGKLSGGNFVSFVSGFGFRFADTGRDGFLDQLSPAQCSPGGMENILKFTEEFLGPYYRPISPDQISERQEHFREVLHGAQVFGVRVIAADTLVLRPEWGERLEGHTVAFPALKYIVYDRDGKVRDVREVIESNVW